LHGSGLLGLTPYKAKILELVLLLHDTHRLGSHALDRVFASMPGAPSNFNSWWPANDFHEYHGAIAIARDPEVRKILGKYYDDVMTILTSEDLRPAAAQDADYGPLHPKLNTAEVASLKKLKSELDRGSYIKLDFLRSGFDVSIITEAIQGVERHEQTLTARDFGIQLNISEHLGESPYSEVAHFRSFYRAELATLAVGCLAEQVIFHKGVWDRAKATHSVDYLSSPKFYRDIRDKSLQGRYDEIFSEEALSLLEAAQTGRGMCVEDVYAPLLTLTLADISESGGWKHFGDYVPSGVAQSFCGIPRQDMTLLEVWFRRALLNARLDTNIHLLTSNDFGKTFEYDVCRHGQDPVREKAQTHCDKSLIKLIVAARAIDTHGKPVDLSAMKRTLCEFLVNTEIVVSPEVLDNFNPRVFCELGTPAVFSQAVRSKVAGFTPEWIRKGGSGIVD
jgi:hypothetical protein